MYGLVLLWMDGWIDVVVDGWMVQDGCCGWMDGSGWLLWKTMAHEGEE